MMNADEVLQAVTIDDSFRQTLQTAWLRVMELAVWGDVKSGRLGAMSRVRRRVLETGEKLHSLCAARVWIPHPREQLKNALGSSMALKDTLLQLERGIQDVDAGADRPALLVALHELTQQLNGQLPALENRWAALLDTQYLDEDEGDDE